MISDSNQFRIISGSFRHRVLEFPNAPGLRPTPDRVRETLFNWLQLSIPGARCLDLFTGSGSLGFEALSRGAASVTGLDTSPEVITHIQMNASILGINDFLCSRQDALLWLNHFTEHAYDVIFLDPPYGLRLLPEVLRLLSNQQVLVPGGYVYIEDNEPLEAIDLPVNWQLIRCKKAGQVHYGLCQYMTSTQQSS